MTSNTSEEPSAVTTKSGASDQRATSALPTKRKVLKRVRKNRDKNEDGVADSSTETTASMVSVNLGADVCKTLTSSRLYFALLLLRFLLIFITPATLEGTEFSDGVDSLAASLLPGMGVGGSDPLLIVPPEGMGTGNRTRSIVGAFVSSGIPFMGVNVFCSKVVSSCTPTWIGYLAMYAPRIWMFFLSLITDVLLVRCFSVYDGENAQHALLTYATSWTTLIAMTRNMNFSLEAMCVTALIAACFGWKPNVARPVFWLSGMALSFGIFLRPPFAFFIFVPIIYLSSLWGKSGIEPLRYVRASLEGLAIFAFWCVMWVTVDSVYYGTFKFRFGETVIESFDMFLEHCTSGAPFSYKGALVYTPIEALKTVANKQFLSTLTMNTSPGQMFLSLPAILGPLFLVLMRESYDGMKVAMKELMSEIKQVANSKKSKKRKSKKAGMTKELEDELYVYHDTIQTTFLLGLLIEVVQNHDRLGVLSLLSLIPPCIACIGGRVFGPDSFPRFRMLHFIFTAAMVIFFGILNQSGITQVMLRAGNGGLPSIVPNSDVVVYRGVIGHRSFLGPNVKNITIHDGGMTRLNLMTTLRGLKSKDEYVESQLVVLAAATVEMKDSEFELIDTVAYGHMSALDMPSNIDEAVRKSTLSMYRFIGDEDEAIIRDDEEAAEQEEQEREKKNEQENKEDL